MIPATGSAAIDPRSRYAQSLRYPLAPAPAQAARDERGREHTKRDNDGTAR